MRVGHLGSEMSLLCLGLCAVVKSVPIRQGGNSVMQNILMNTERSGRYGYPTDFTRDIVPVCYEFNPSRWTIFPSLASWEGKWRVGMVGCHDDEDDADSW